MLFISLFAHIQRCAERYQTRRSLRQLTAQQMQDMGLSEEIRQYELSQANLTGFLHDLRRLNA